MAMLLVFLFEGPYYSTMTFVSPDSKYDVSEALSASIHFISTHKKKNSVA
jgi:hypothetical protein